MKKQQIIMEHYYIPLGLFVLNCCLIHFLYALFAGDLHSPIYRVALGAVLLALVFTIMAKYKWGILLSSLCYLLLLLAPCWMP